MYTATANERGETIGFAMADVDRQGTAPTNVAGRLTRAGLTLDLTIPFATRVGTRSTVSAS